MDEVIKETVVEGEPEDVFETVLEQLEEWSADRPSVIESVDPPREVVFWWMDDPSRVDITVEPADGGSLVRIVEKRAAFSALASV
jgi:hypothetical protein